MTAFGVVLFHTTSAALRAEKLAQHEGLSVKLVPTPRRFTSECGFALRFGWHDQETLEALLGREKVETAGTHRLEEADV